ncbi:hypothetical protein B0H11DRAFT_1922131 [Mycena galericulata]|nr:hypothetical protein B0H11DRAFT_1922131 [Mycena galericulata]
MFPLCQLLCIQWAIWVWARRPFPFRTRGGCLSRSSLSCLRRSFCKRERALVPSSGVGLVGRGKGGLFSTENANLPGAPLKELGRDLWGWHFLRNLNKVSHGKQGILEVAGFAREQYSGELWSEGGAAGSSVK